MPCRCVVSRKPWSYYFVFELYCTHQSLPPAETLYSRTHQRKSYAFPDSKSETVTICTAQTRALAQGECQCSLNAVHCARYSFDGERIGNVLQLFQCRFDILELHLRPIDPSGRVGIKVSHFPEGNPRRATLHLFSLDVTADGYDLQRSVPGAPVDLRLRQNAIWKGVSYQVRVGPEGSSLIGLELTYVLSVHNPVHKRGC
jgi:hypothetical protein